MQNVYSELENTPVNVIDALVANGRWANWAGHPEPQRAMAHAILNGASKLNYLPVGEVLAEVVTRVINAHFANNHRLVMPTWRVLADGSTEGQYTEHFWYRRGVEKEVYSIITDGFAFVHDQEAVAHHRWQAGMVDGVDRVGQLEYARGVYRVVVPVLQD